MESRRNIIIIICLLIQSCTFHKSINPDSVDRIVFFAMCKGVEYVQGVGSFSELKDRGRDTVITDRSFISRFVEELNMLIPDKHGRPIDYRAAALLFNHEGDSTLVLFGERSGIVYQNRVMMDRDSLFRLIDESVYEKQPYDYWFPSVHSRELYRNAFESVMKFREQQSIKNDSLENNTLHSTIVKGRDRVDLLSGEIDDSIRKRGN